MFAIETQKGGRGLGEGAGESPRWGHSGRMYNMRKAFEEKWSLGENWCCLRLYNTSFPFCVFCLRSASSNHYQKLLFRRVTKVQSAGVLRRYTLSCVESLWHYFLTMASAFKSPHFNCVRYSPYIWVAFAQSVSEYKGWAFLSPSVFQRKIGPSASLSCFFLYLFFFFSPFLTTVLSILKSPPPVLPQR